MPGDLFSCCEPDAIVAPDVVDKLPQSLEASWFSNETTVQTNRHHFGLTLAAFLVHDIETGFAVVEPVLRRD